VPNVAVEHFMRAAADVGANDDIDTLPFDSDDRFIAENGRTVRANITPSMEN
jgi:hypothetical protein